MFSKSLSLLFAVLLICKAQHVLSQNINETDGFYSKDFIASIIEKVNTYQYTNPWVEKDQGWIRGTYYTGVMACYQATGNNKYLEQCDAWGKTHNWGIVDLAPDSEESGANLLTSAQTWLESYLVNRQKYKIQPTIVHLENPNFKNPVSRPITWYHEYGIRYADAIYVCSPALAMLSKITKNKKYLEWMDSFFWDLYGTLFNETDNLFYRDFRYRFEFFSNGFGFPRPDSIKYEDSRKPYVYQKTQDGHKVYWSRANGWALAGIARILTYLPKDYGNYKKYEELFVRLATEIKKRQRPDGFWYPNLDDPKDFGTKESSGTGLFTYAIAWGINNGILNRDEYLPVVKKSWAGLVSVVSQNGKVQWGQLVSRAPYKILQEDSHEYVTGAFLLAASEMFKMGK